MNKQPVSEARYAEKSGTHNWRVVAHTLRVSGLILQRILIEVANLSHFRCSTAGTSWGTTVGSNASCKICIIRFGRPVSLSEHACRLRGRIEALIFLPRTQLIDKVPRIVRPALPNQGTSLSQNKSNLICLYEL